VEARVLAAAEALFDDADTIVGELLTILGRKSVRDYLRRQFFRDHLRRYSRSRRKAPIFWPLTPRSRTWGVWIYAARIDRETFYAIAAEARRRERLADEAIVRLGQEKAVGGAGRAVRRVIEELDAESKLAGELRGFREEAERVGELGWEPDLDDGIVLCAAPLADLFPAWPEAGARRRELEAGRHAWSTVARWKEKL
jgi:hypothetical protein